MWTILRSQLGMSMVEGVMAFGLLGGAALFVADSVSKGADAEKQVAVRQMLLKTRSTFIQTLRSPDALSNIAKENNYRCLEDFTGCSNTGYTAITVVDGAGEKYTDSTNSHFGLTLGGQTCTSYPSASCPLRYRVRMKTICSDSDCRVPQFKFLGELAADNSLDRVPLNLFEFEIVAGQAIDSYERSCTSLGGTYLPGSPPGCLLAMAGDCPRTPSGAWQGVVGYDRTNKTKTCKPIFTNFMNGKTCKESISCSPTNPEGTPGEVIVGVDTNGDPVCMPMKPNPKCSSMCDTSPECMPLTPCQVDPTPPECNPPIPAPDPAPVSWGDGGCGGADGGAC